MLTGFGLTHFKITQPQENHGFYKYTTEIYGQILGIICNMLASAHFNIFEEKEKGKYRNHSMKFKSRKYITLIPLSIICDLTIKIEDK